VKGFDEAAGSGWVRLRRDGDKVKPAWSRDGVTWTELPAAEVRWDVRVSVGVAAQNLLGVPAVVTFDRFALTQSKK
jgi:hypothetical protein